MKYWVLSILVAVISYCFGSLSTIVLASNFAFRANLSRLGKGNVWLSNFRRIYGVKGFLRIAAVEIIRDVLPILLAGWLFGKVEHADVGKALAAFCLIMGRMYPYIYELKGSCALLCMIVASFCVSASVGAMIAVISAAVIIFTRYIPLGVVAGAFTEIVTSVLLIDDGITEKVCIITGIAVIVHAVPSITRILSGKEEKLSFKDDISYKFDEKF